MVKDIVKKVIEEQKRNRFKGLVRVSYTESASTMDVSEILRSIEDVTIVDTAGTDDEDDVAIYEIKFFSLKEPLQAFETLKSKAQSFPEIKKVEIATKSIESF